MSSFMMVVGGIILTLTIIASWIVKYSELSIYMKLCLILCLVMMGCTIPWTQVHLADSAVPVQLNRCLDIVWLKADGDDAASLWLKDSNRIATITSLNSKFKDVLREVKSHLLDGEPVVRICPPAPKPNKNGREKREKREEDGNKNGREKREEDGNDSKMEIDRSIFSHNLK